MNETLNIRLREMNRLSCITADLVEVLVPPTNTAAALRETVDDLNAICQLAGCLLTETERARALAAELLREAEGATK